MKTITVTLPVLLIALCRISFGELVSWSYVYTYAMEGLGNESTFSLPPAIKAEQYQKFVLGNFTSHHFHHLNELLGNTIYAMILDRLGLYESLPEYYRNALDNGVLCEVNEGLTDGAIKSIQYHADMLSREQRLAEIEAAKDPAIGIDCNARPATYPDAAHLFCKQNNVLLYSAALKFKERIEKASGFCVGLRNSFTKLAVTRKTCQTEQMAPIQLEMTKSVPTGSPLAFVYTFYFPDNAQKDFLNVFNSLEAPSASNTDFNAVMHCLALQPETKIAVRTLFAANALRWTLEGQVFQEVFKGEHKDIDSACAVETFKNSEVGRCACSKDTGIAFCIQRIRAIYYRNIGFLTCDGEKMAFNSEVRPASIRPIACLFDKTAADTAPECNDDGKWHGTWKYGDEY